MTGKNLTAEERALLNSETQALFQKDGSWQKHLLAEIASVLKLGKRAYAARQL
jgi:hypothetical protein